MLRRKIVCTKLSSGMFERPSSMQHGGAGQGQTQNKCDFVHFQENVTAGEWAYREAGITDPFKEILQRDRPGRGA